MRPELARACPARRRGHALARRCPGV